MTKEIIIERVMKMQSIYSFLGVDFSNEIIGNLSNLKFDSIHDLYKHVMN